MEWIMSIVLAEERNQTLLLTLNRPDARNAISSDLAELLTQHLRSVADRRDIRAIIITGAGDQAFSAGTDLKERRTLSPDQKWAQRTKGWDLNQAIWHQPQPVIAAVNGWCLGGGFELALFCDLRVASESAVFAFPEMTLGAFPGSGAHSDEISRGFRSNPATCSDRRQPGIPMIPAGAAVAIASELI
jgi:enoyl-CoA hydratase/carnithine racemase